MCPSLSTPACAPLPRCVVFHTSSQAKGCGPVLLNINNVNSETVSICAMLSAVPRSSCGCRSSTQQVHIPASRKEEGGKNEKQRACISCLKVPQSRHIHFCLRSVAQNLATWPCTITREAGKLGFISKVMCPSYLEVLRKWGKEILRDN